MDVDREDGAVVEEADFLALFEAAGAAMAGKTKAMPKVRLNEKLVTVSGFGTIILGALLQFILLASVYFA
ncbi:hypothetical protein KBI23_15995 [bacterium]|nr:hypothetical protein [bacterium]MBP9810900.1 hypothetical protein [bacterium]